MAATSNRKIAAAFTWALCLALCAPTWAAPSAAPFVGRWVLQVGGRNLMVLTLAPGGGAQALVGALMRPKQFSLSGARVSDVRLPAIEESVVAAQLTDDGVRFTVRDTADPKNTDDFELRLKGADTAALSFVIAPSAPMAMTRAADDAQVASDWRPDVTYGPQEAGASNAEMARLFAADQADRQGLGPIDWAKVTKADAGRRRAVAALLRAGQLRTGTDFIGAAFVFQHGDKADDILLAHVLAMAAMSKGRLDADWIAAASLDRYLQRTGKPQVFGTQFSRRRGASKATQEPFDRALIPDALRGAIDVPALAAQASPLGR